MNMRVPAEVFPPGEFLREELEARGWSQQELADILDRPARLISELISAKRAVTPETAKGLGDAFETGPEYWMNLESQYQLSKVKSSDDTVGRKARLYGKFPVREMLRRGWVRASENIDVLERRFCEFFEIPDVSVEPAVSHAAKKTAATDAATMLQRAWLFRVKSLAREQQIDSYSRDKLLFAVKRAKALLTAPEEARHAPRLMAEAGVRLVFVEPLPGSRIDGACLWLDDNKPVIGMSLRFDRIDNFWFVLRHEIEHVLRADGKTDPILDSDVGEPSDGLPEYEVLANSAGADFCTPSDQLADFIARVAPYFSEQRVVLFANRIGVHPGLVVGQLQRKLGRHDFLRKHQVKIRSCVIPSGQVDGWGSFSE
jgi:HTH-type transcriptional regulator / antitoxin HigA